ncbi:unnamed protein product, partial [Dicrocoelium dendriticum]
MLIDFLYLNLLLLVCSYVAVQFVRGYCFKLEQELAYCAQRHKVRIPKNQFSGYSFGYGSLNETEAMCRTKWHILIFKCLRKRSEETCRNNEEEMSRQLIWSISLETDKFERAAAYICHEHNLRIFRDHRDKCLLMQEKLAEQCTLNRNETVREVVVALQDQSSKSTLNSDEYYKLIKHTLSEYECKSMKAKLECLYTLLHDNCPPDAVRLIMNYFMETLPDGCLFSYDDRLLRHLQSKSFDTGETQNAHDNGVFLKLRKSGTEAAIQSTTLHERNRGTMQSTQQRLHKIISVTLTTIILWNSIA